MLRSDDNFGPQSIELMSRALDASWKEIRAEWSFATVAAEAAALKETTRAIMHAVFTGERDPERLRLIAVKAFNGDETGRSSPKEPPSIFIEPPGSYGMSASRKIP